MEKIKNVKVTKVEKDGRVLFEWEKEHPTMGISYWNWAPNCNVGDKGFLIYKSSLAAGLWVFRKE
jgi:hypothetical protein